MSTLSTFFLNRIRRSLLASFGLLLSTFGFYLQLVANIGLSPWTALNQGLSLHLPITFGQASILVSVIIIVVDLLMRETIGLGTILDALLVGWGSDFFIALDLIPEQDSFLSGLGILFIGLVFASVGQWAYMKAALSCGPRDSLLVALGKKVPKVPIGWVNIFLNLMVAIVAFLLGGQIGVGTLIALFGTGMVMDLVFFLVRFEPRDVVHEGLLNTVQEFRKAIKG